MLFFYYLLFLFIAFGVKLILALVMIYMLLMVDTRCNGCGEETLLIAPTGWSRWLSRMMLGRVQRRWCPRCGWYGLARRVPPPREPSGHRVGTITRTTR